MNAITVPKNPPTAMMGIKTSISSSRRRSLARSDPLILAVLRKQALGEVEPLFALPQPTLELFDLGEQPLRITPEHHAMPGGLHGHPLLIRPGPAANPLRQRLPDGARQYECGPDDQRQADYTDGGYPLFHATVLLPLVNLPS